MSNDPLLSVRGTELVDRSGNPVVLRGYNIGGWMNMENFLTGYPSTETLHRQALRTALGDDRYQLFFQTFYDAFFSDQDAAYIKSLGLNSVRIPFNYKHFEDDDRPFEHKQSGFTLLDQAVDACARHGLYAILDFHAFPGHQNQHWHSDNPTHWAGFWTHRHFQDRAVRLWEALADRYRGNPWVAGYNVMNEPADASGEAVGPFYARVREAILAVDPDHILFLDGNTYSTDFSFFDPEPWPNTVYALHDYKTPGFIDGGPYPGETNGVYVDRGEVERTFLARAEYMQRTGTPIWVGETGPVYTGDPERDEMRYQLLQDQLDIYREHGAGWCLWAYKDVGGQGAVYARPDSPWMQRIRPITEKKARLGVDRWGGLDTGVRHILDPIDRTFAEEYPDFTPYPFGAKQWYEVLVRHIMLAEPMVKDFGRCFEGITDDETVVALAESFRFDRCAIREPLEALLREAAKA